ncbi:MAG: hypothetical protein JSW54_05525 [Fidelibacterota bacterium]|nr:MAG: hypothetical protein JSW54_05525 [Candidatus Neomarinimicrobiota bacterium]
MKVTKIIVLPLAYVLILSGVLLATRDYATIKDVPTSFEYNTAWHARSFDEAVWFALDDIARIEDNLPPEVENFRVAIQSPDETIPKVHLEFDRVSLTRLKAGEISPVNFIRDHVEFN